jgi:ribosomal protein L35
MTLESGDNQGFYQQRDFPERLALRAAAAAERPEQTTFGAFKDRETMERAINARKEATFARQSREQAILDQSRSRRT